jgi:hypothetical protein
MDKEKLLKLVLKLIIEYGKNINTPNALENKIYKQVIKDLLRLVKSCSVCDNCTDKNEQNIGNMYTCDICAITVD